MIVVCRFLNLYDFGCRVTVLQNMVSSTNILAVLRHWIPSSTNHHTIAMAEKVNYTENKL